MKRNLNLIGTTLIFLLAGCAGGGMTGDSAFWGGLTEKALVWPGPPNPPRIQFLRTLGAEENLSEPGKVDRFFRWVTGEKKQLVPVVSPYGVAADGLGSVWLADPGAGVVHVFNMAHNRTDYLSVAGNDELVSPQGVAVDTANERVYVSDSVLGQVFVFNITGDFLSTLKPPLHFERPSGLATDLWGNLYVTDVQREVVDVFDAEGNFIRTIGANVPDEWRMNHPSNVCVDHLGQVYVADSFNFRIVVFDREGVPLRAIGEMGDVPGALARPRGVAVDSEGHVYVSDAAFDNVQIFDGLGNLLLYFGALGGGPGQFNLPAGLYVDAEDRLYVADSFNRRVQIFQYLAEDRVK
jgi:DNA-binding beta-propeller fold protein YncE